MRHLLEFAVNEFFLHCLGRDDQTFRENFGEESLKSVSSNRGSRYKTTLGQTHQIVVVVDSYCESSKGESAWVGEKVNFLK